MILIVDDQKDVGTALERLLRYAGHESVSVTGGAEVLAMLHIRKPAVRRHPPVWLRGDRLGPGARLFTAISTPSRTLSLQPCCR